MPIKICIRNNFINCLCKIFFNKFYKEKIDVCANPLNTDNWGTPWQRESFESVLTGMELNATNESVARLYNCKLCYWIYTINITNRQRNLKGFVVMQVRKC